MIKSLEIEKVSNGGSSEYYTQVGSLILSGDTPMLLLGEQFDLFRFDINSKTAINDLDCFTEAIMKPVYLVTLAILLLMIVALSIR